MKVTAPPQPQPAWLSPEIRERIAAYCAEYGETFDAVLADAVALHLDELESINLMEHV